MRDPDAEMRTTVNIDDHLLAEAKALAARQRRPVGAVIDDALRAELARTARRPTAPVELTTAGDPADRPLVDILDREALADALGDNERLH